MYYCAKNEAGEDIEVARSDAARLRQHRILMPVAETAEGPRKPQGMRRSENRQDRRKR